LDRSIRWRYRHGVLRVLAIDGGGVRGIIPLRVLAELERCTGRRTAELFDVIAGTSTGGIVALILTRPPGELPQATADQLLQDYLDLSSVIFPHLDIQEWREWWAEAGAKAVTQRIGATLYPHHYGNSRYLAHGLESMLERELGDSRLADAVTDVVIPSYDMKAGRAVIFRSRDAREGRGPNPATKDVARATSAAPTYFPPLRLLLDDLGELVLIDGSVTANNPVALGFFDALERCGDDGPREFIVVSLGTGLPPAEVPTYEEIWSRGWLSLAMGLLGVMASGTSELADDVVSRAVALHPAPGSYWRFQPELRGCSLHMDDASDENVSAVRSIAEELVAERQGDIEAIAAAVTVAEPQMQ
jgi:predicted acylesterase/phospholipase RssA